MFEKSLSSLVQGLRACNGRETEYINDCLREVKMELKSTNLKTKSVAVLKLWYLQMLGVDIRFGLFQIIELMCSPKISNKRPSFSLCSTCFDRRAQKPAQNGDNTDGEEKQQQIAAEKSREPLSNNDSLLLLTTNIFHKCLTSGKEPEVLLALGSLSNIANEQLALDMADDVNGLLNNSKVAVRKKAVICCCRLYSYNQELLNSSFPKLRERLSDSEPAVLCAVVNTMYELARGDPWKYLVLVPQLYHILTNNTNSWLTIKLLKFLSLLCEVEPRLPGKLEVAVHELMISTKAKSVEYEAIAFSCTHLNIVPVTQNEGEYQLRFKEPKIDFSKINETQLEGKHSRILDLTTRFKAFIGSSDKNLKFLTFELLAKTLSRKDRPYLQFQILSNLPDIHQNSLQAIDDVDPTLVQVGLATLKMIVTRTSFKNVVEMLLNKYKPNRQSDLILTILELAAHDCYALVEDKIWYLGVLTKLALLDGQPQARAVAKHLADINLRFATSRRKGVELSAFLLGCKATSVFSNTGYIPAGEGGQYGGGGMTGGVSSFIIGASAWVVGEYGFELLPNPSDSGFDTSELIACLLNKSKDSKLPSNVRQICLLATLKVLVMAAESGNNLEIRKSYRLLNQNVESLSYSSAVEIGQRASFLSAILSTYNPYGADHGKSQKNSNLNNSFSANIHSNPNHHPAQLNGNIKGEGTDESISIKGLRCIWTNNPVHAIGPEAQSAVPFEPRLNEPFFSANIAIDSVDKGGRHVESTQVVSPAKREAICDSNEQSTQNSQLTAETPPKNAPAARILRPIGNVPSQFETIKFSIKQRTFNLEAKSLDLKVDILFIAKMPLKNPMLKIADGNYELILRSEEASPSSNNFPYNVYFQKPGTFTYYLLDIPISVPYPTDMSNIGHSTVPAEFYDLKVRASSSEASDNLGYYNLTLPVSHTEYLEETCLTEDEMATFMQSSSSELSESYSCKFSLLRGGAAESPVELFSLLGKQLNMQFLAQSNSSNPFKCLLIAKQPGEVLVASNMVVCLLSSTTTTVDAKSSAITSMSAPDARGENLAGTNQGSLGRSSPGNYLSAVVSPGADKTLNVKINVRSTSKIFSALVGKEIEHTLYLVEKRCNL